MTSTSSVEISGPTMVVKETEVCNRPHADERKKISVQGKARRVLLPDEALVKIGFNATEPTGSLVESRYREWVMKVSEIINEMGELTFSSPTFSTQVKEIQGKEERTTSLKAHGYVHIPVENIGNVLIGLLEEGIDFDAPDFSFDEGRPLEPELYQEASSVAKQNAQALLNGVESQLGKFIGLTFFDSDNETVTHSLSSFKPELFTNKMLLTSNFQIFDNLRGAIKGKIGSRGKNLEKQDSEEIIDWDPKVLSLLSTKVPTKIQEIVVTVTYEVQV